MYLTNQSGRLQNKRRLFQTICDSRKHDTWACVPLILFVITLLSCSRNSNSLILFQGDPGLYNLPAKVELQQFVGDARPFKLSTLKYENLIREKLTGETKLTYTSLVKLKDQNEQFAVTKTEYFFVQPNGQVSKQVTDVDVGVPGIVSLVQLTTKQQTPQQVQFRKVASRLDNANGRLFPLENGNQLSLAIVFLYQVTQGSTNNTAQEMVWSYRFRIVKHYEGYTLSGKTIPGKVYIIDKHEIDPDGNIDNTLVHYSESLGVVVNTVRQGEKYIDETRLVSMEQ